jgi:hypothetical protein
MGVGRGASRGGWPREGRELGSADRPQARIVRGEGTACDGEREGASPPGGKREGRGGKVAAWTRIEETKNFMGNNGGRAHWRRRPCWSQEGKCRLVIQTQRYPRISPTTHGSKVIAR